MLRPLYALSERGGDAHGDPGGAGRGGFARSRGGRPSSRARGWWPLPTPPTCAARCSTPLRSGRCAKPGVLFLLDASQTAGAVPIDVESLGVDFLAAPGHKGLLGPQGTGILYVAPGIALKPLLHGGTGSSSESRAMPEEMPEASGGGNAQHAGHRRAVGGGALPAGTGRRPTCARTRSRSSKRCFPSLRAVSGPLLYGPMDPARARGRGFVQSGGRDGAHVGFALDEAFRHRRARGPPLRAGRAQEPGTRSRRGTVRASFGPFNTVEDAERLSEAMDGIFDLSVSAKGDP